MRHLLAISLILPALFVRGSSSLGAPPPSCVEPATPLRYPDVQPILEKRCATCHDARASKNPRAQAVFEMSRYPFATKRPATLRSDLQRIIPNRGFDPTDKCRLLSWLASGAL